MPRRKIGLALGSGAARGWSHIGVVEALLEAGIVPEVVCGTSIGALVGAAYVTDKLAALRTRVETFGRRDMVAMVDVRFSGGGLIEGRRIGAFLRDLGISAPIESLHKRFAAVVTDLATGREVWLEKGPIDEAVRASISVPGVFSPVRLDGAWYLDGALVNPVPVSVCRALGADVIIAVNLSGDLVGRRFTDEGETAASAKTATARREFVGRLIDGLPPSLKKQAGFVAKKLLQPEAAPGYLDVLANALNIMQDRVTRTRLAGEPPDVLLSPRLAGMRWTEFHRGSAAIAAGRTAVQKALPVLREYL
ncbi:MAG TPA: patatin-like phospholipase RssA [Rhizomicrobium sp.]